MSSITLEQLFRQLSFGELSNLAVALDGIGSIKKEQQPRVIFFLNEALERLHLRFALLESGEVLTWTLGQSPNNAPPPIPLPMSPAIPGYWVGTLTGNWPQGFSSPLPTDVLLVTSILNAYGQSVEIGDKPVPNEVFVFDGTDTTQSPPVQTKIFNLPLLRNFTTEMQITYQHRHPVILAAPVVDLTQAVTIKPELQEAVTSYIAARMYSGINSPDAIQTAAMYRQRYEQVVQECLMQGLMPAELLKVDKLRARGFV